MLIAVTACSNEAETGGVTGSLSLGLDVISGSQIDAVQYTVTGNGIERYRNASTGSSGQPRQAKQQQPSGNCPSGPRVR